MSAAAAPLHRPDTRYQAGGRILAARSDGGLDARLPVLLPFMAPRLQGDFHPDGTLALSLWAAGHLATLSVTPFEGVLVYRPNSVTGPRHGFHVAQSAPVLVLRQCSLRRVVPARRAAGWHRVTGKPSGSQAREALKRIVTVDWGVVIIEPRGADLVVAAGQTRAEAEAGLRLSVDAIIAEASAYAAACDRLANADPLLRAMVVQGTHAALSSIRRNAQGGFGGLAAGQAYSAPARTYYRDGYWTLQPLLRLAPEVVRAQIDMLASGVQPDGEAPSGVIVADAAQARAWDAVRLTHDAYTEHLRPRDWWSDHFDSPLFFVLTLGDYVRATGDLDAARQHWKTVLAIFARYERLSNSAGLPIKPRNDRDWADNVYRGGLVSYDIGLFVGALDAIADMGKTIDPAAAGRAAAHAVRARKAVDEQLWQAARGHYADYIDGAFAEDHFALDSLTLLRFTAGSDDHARAALAQAARLLESRANADQPYGDWGMLCAFPPFKRPADTRAKTAFAYRYHNGADWPYWSAVYAEERLRRGLGGARYALTRWFSACLDSGWAGAVEYYSPPFGRGSLLQGWSGLPAHVAVTYADKLRAER